MASVSNHEADAVGAFQAGRRLGLGVAALAASLVAGVSMLGAEKAILAIVLGRLAMRGEERGTLAWRLGLIAIGIGIVFLVTLVVVLIVFWGHVGKLIEALQSLS